MLWLVRRTSWPSEVIGERTFWARRAVGSPPCGLDPVVQRWACLTNTRAHIPSVRTRPESRVKWDFYWNLMSNILRDATLRVNLSMEKYSLTNKSPAVLLKINFDDFRSVEGRKEGRRSVTCYECILCCKIPLIIIQSIQYLQLTDKWCEVKK